MRSVRKREDPGKSSAQEHLLRVIFSKRINSVADADGHWTLPTSSSGMGANSSSRGHRSPKLNSINLSWSRGSSIGVGASLK